jgi:hypothetical protein
MPNASHTSTIWAYFFFLGWRDKIKKIMPDFFTDET